MGRRRERWARRKQVYPFLLPPVRQRFAPPRAPRSGPELNAYQSGREGGGGGPSPAPSELSLSEQAAFDRARWTAAGNDELRAPIGWPLEAMFLALQAAAADSGPEPDPHQPLAAFVDGAPALLTGWLLERAKSDLERQRARQLGLAPETTPQISPTSWVYALAATLVQHGYLFVTRRRLRQPPWPRVLATGLIREFDRRRAWNAARAVAREAAAGD